MADDIIFDRVSVNPSRRSGALCVVGSRLTVAEVAAMVREGRSMDDVLADHPQLTRAGIEQTLALDSALRASD